MQLQQFVQSARAIVADARQYTSQPVTRIDIVELGDDERIHLKRDNLDEAAPKSACCGHTFATTVF